MADELTRHEVDNSRLSACRTYSQSEIKMIHEKRQRQKHSKYHSPDMIDHMTHGSSNLVHENFTDTVGNDSQRQLKKSDERLFSQPYLSSCTISRTQLQKILDANSAYFNKSTSRELHQRVSSNDNLRHDEALKKD